jgi:hypothetical protein
MIDMAKPKSALAGQTTVFRPNPASLADTIHKLAENTAVVFFSDHAVERMEEREITRLDALRVLRTGRILGDIEPGKKPAEWKCKVVARLKGSREIGVVTLCISERRLLVKTVEWEDLS